MEKERRQTRRETGDSFNHQTLHSNFFPLTFSSSLQRPSTFPPFITSSHVNNITFGHFCHPHYHILITSTVPYHLPPSHLLASRLHLPPHFHPNSSYLPIDYTIRTLNRLSYISVKLRQLNRRQRLDKKKIIKILLSFLVQVNDAQRRGKMMLSFAWSVAAVCSLPQVSYIQFYFTIYYHILQFAL